MADANALLVQGSATGTPLPMTGPGSGVTIGVVEISHATPGTTDYMETRSSCRRNAGILHRSAVLTPDRLAPPAAVTAANNVGDVAGALAFNTAYNVNSSAGNRWGVTTVPTAGSVTTTNDAANTHSVRLTLAQVAGADYYDLFLSTAAAPLWVARITESQRAAGGFTVTAVGTVTLVGAAPAGTVDVRVVGTGLASNVNPFILNTAFTPALITPIDCRGFTLALIQYKMTVDDLRSLPTLTLAAFIQNQNSTGDWHSNTVNAPGLLATVTNPLEQIFTSTVSGATALVVVVETMTGQGASLNVWVDLA